MCNQILSTVTLFKFKDVYILLSTHCSCVVRQERRLGEKVSCVVRKERRLGEKVSCVVRKERRLVVL